MANLGGGAEAHARFKQYEYRANSSLVLTTDNRPRDTHEPTGEPETLWGKIDPRSFGDRVAKGRPQELEDKLKKSKKKERDVVDDMVNIRQSKRRRLREESVLTDTDDAVYQPKTKETRAAYEAMLGLIQKQLGGQPPSIVSGAADEILAVLKNDAFRNPEKKMEIEKLLNKIENHEFDQLVSIGKLITDFQEGGDSGGGRANDDEGLDDDLGVAVEFEENEEDDEESDPDMVEEDDDEEDDEPTRTGGMQVDAGINDEDAGDANEGTNLNVQDIDAYWLQRKISQAYEQQIDPQQCQVLAEELLKILAEGDDRVVEDKLLMHLQYEKFSLVKFLLRNRLKVVWCTRLARAEDQEERNRIEEEMRGLGPELTAIVEQLHATRATAKEREENLQKSINEEARRLKDETGGDGGRGRRDVADRDSESGWVKGQRQMLDLESLAFDQGGLLMANKKCDLPPGSYRSHGKGYDEVHVPWVSKKVDRNEKLVKITEMPDWAQPAFKGMQQLNRVQSKVYDTALFKAENILLCAPTGAGKTNVAMLTILQQLEMNRNTDGTYNHGDYKIVYVAPMKALVAEVVGNLSNRLKDYGVIVRELSGDQSLTGREIEETQIIVTTPEKWDIITRKSGDRTYTQLVRLLIIDEIHLLHDNRGPVLESIVARTLRQIETTKENIRLVGLSATLPNYEDVALFLRVDLKKGLFKFDRSYRPVPLHQQYIGISVKKPLQRFQLMNDLCYQKVLAGAGKHQVLIFVHSRKETSKTARAIRDTAMANDTLSRFLKEDSVTRDVLHSHEDIVKNSDLKDILPYGFAIHHAGLSRGDREIVETLFSQGHVQVLVSTATLAWGVNLPAHTVIIKGTQVYNPEKGAWMELSPLDVMQMLGRAGRPQYDQHGEGIIITGYSELQYYLSLMNEQLPIESQFISKLADQLNAEIVLGTVQNAREACHWLGYTYLYIRMVRNPTLYGLAPDALAKDVVLEERRADLIHSAATILDKNNLVKYDRKSGYFQVTDLGRIASYYYITHGTIATYNEHLKPTMGDIDLYRLFSLSDEFKYVTVRQDEKMELAKLLDRVPIPIKETLEEPSAKINVLLQAYISQLKLEGLSLTSDMVYITQSAGRLVRALYEIVLKRGWAQLAEKALNLSKMVGKRMWSVQTPLRQFHGLSNDILMQLEKKDLVWERYYDLSAQELGELIRSPKMGKPLHKFIHQFPKVTLSAHVQPITRTVLNVELTVTPDFLWDEKIHKYVEPFWIIVEDNDGEKILHHEYFLLKKQYIDEDHTLHFTVPIFEPLPPQYFVRVVSDKWLGSETVLPVSFRHLILPEKYPPPTELLDLQPLPVTALRNPNYEILYQDFKHFNPVQTQVFTVLYNTNDNVLVAAPTGSGKTICAEFAILRNHHEGPDATMRVVYIAPLEAIAKEQFRIWEGKFGKGLGLRVVELTGETALDLKLLEKGQIIISTPEKWDALSRRWKQRKYVQQVSLFIVDELHLIGGQHGPVLEVIVSRMRYISSQVINKIRIVALSTSLANAKDLGEWIGASSHGLFNFPPGVRPVPLEIHIQGVDISSFEARMQAMTKPTYTAIVQHAKNKKPAIVFVPTRKHVRLTAVDLMAYSHMDNPQSPDFLLGKLEELDPFVEQIREETLKETLCHGIGYLHEGLSSLDQEIVTQLFEAGRIQVCVMSSSLCWGTPLTAHLVVVMGTQYYDGRENSHSDYPVPDLLQMMGRASRPLLDNAGKCVIFCHAPRKEYYKKFLYEAFPVESQLQHFLHDNFNAEVVAGVIENKQDAVDYLTWTFMYRRLPQNPNYYNLQGVSHRHLSDHLSELVENTLSDLEASKCIEVEDEMELSPLNLGMIASYYYISYTTIERFSSLLSSKTKMKGLLEILTSASEYDMIPIRPGEEDTVRRLINHQRFSFENPKCTDPHVKANALLQAHFSRQNIGGNLAMDQRDVLLSATRLLQAMVDVISSNGWLNLALLAMEVSQMVTQGMWERDSMLLQLPHFTKDLAKRCQENPGKNIETVFDLVEMEDEERQELLKMSDAQLLDIARFCNRFPNIDLTYEIVGSEEVNPGKEVTLQVMLERDMEGRTEVGPVDSLRYPKTKEEGWWLVVGDTKTNQLLAIKRVSLQRKVKVKLDFTAPSEPGEKSYTLYFMCDSYLGCDQEYSFSVDVKGSGAGDRMEE
ncbi:Putative RNA helicase [Arabidopsis thaliana]|uniref:DExH-box ATP-dependent RNA helicase DExH12 n=1 Tax=Arabidopsis thaliana TaxID=3702 RepID=DEXHC_ARATH|nr:U5 small nuclear ribonucleoprotein helicase [Arabidopsis thaliana]NP_173520.1 U5 small nuclear ribonucleoprotein helicase [Arabidopsis thaliana]Q9SYP1.1 RecName: Full=DExH-box ATP-dependent RNA helicase DExH12; AltName: Full=BRR2 homolog A; Short=AtBRR2A; AltName: Full=Pre-mRNA-splicing helicase BRR2A; AltName: Full=Protein EMBRYO DEFECTIVE 1507 [Arabidopsis thaliana]AAD30595.1 Putative RNA helicase [Arabidopsis thaliana]AEE30046.1 U5 small nuclear ribonucleoprotein helicase [Arabidopsis tha|eukprot:NP_001185050.1 U5 small nuclear ribonucleoprotein helicase [Arabidopsis thaliana]